MIKIYDEVIRKQPRFLNSCLFHPTDAVEDPWGKRMLDRMSEDKAVYTIRIYNMLEDIVYRDEEGKLCYDFRLNDLRLDYLTEKGFNLMIAYASVPPCLSDGVSGTSVCRSSTRYKGKLFNSAPPKDYKEWEEVCYTYTKHIVDRYGIETVSKWYLHTFNEPDIPYFFMKDEPWGEPGRKARVREFTKLFEGFSRAVERVDNRLTIGGPGFAEDFPFLEEFLNYVKEKNLRLDYLALHNYSTSPEFINDGTKPIRVSNIFKKHDIMMEIIERCGFGDRQICYDEWGASTHGYLDIRECPDLIMRDNEKFSSFYVKMLDEFVKRNVKISVMAICLTGLHEVTEEFSGFRNFFTMNYINKPIYNAHVLAQKMGDELLKKEGERENLSCVPTKREDGALTVLLGYAKDDLSEEIEDIEETIAISHMKGKTATVYRIDKKTTNPYRLYEKMGMTTPSKEEIKLLLEEGKLKGEEISFNGEITLKFSANSVVLLEIK